MHFNIVIIYFHSITEGGRKTVCRLGCDTGSFGDEGGGSRSEMLVHIYQITQCYIPWDC
jgi:hypothetical protein